MRLVLVKQQSHRHCADCQERAKKVEGDYSWLPTLTNTYRTIGTPILLAQQLTPSRNSRSKSLNRNALT
jgi:hypothetical protein